MQRQTNFYRLFACVSAGEVAEWLEKRYFLQRPGFVPRTNPEQIIGDVNFMFWELKCPMKKLYHPNSVLLDTKNALKKSKKREIECSKLLKSQERITARIHAGDTWRW